MASGSCEVGGKRRERVDVSSTAHAGSVVMRFLGPDAAPGASWTGGLPFRGKGFRRCGGRCIGLYDGPDLQVSDTGGSTDC